MPYQGNWDCPFMRSESQQLALPDTHHTASSCGRLVDSIAKQPLMIICTQQPPCYPAPTIPFHSLLGGGLLGDGVGEALAEPLDVCRLVHGALVELEGGDDGLEGGRLRDQEVVEEVGGDHRDLLASA